MLHTRLATLVFAAAACATSAFAVDGTTLINQSTVMAAGGFPYTITASGSYRLSGDLLVTNSTGINILAPNVTLDLNGFTISCSSCSGFPGIVSNSVNMTVMNGMISGFGGIEAPPGGHIRLARCSKGLFKEKNND